jgi:hypothetical protein
VPSDDSQLERWSRVILQLGVPTVFAVALLWFVLARLLNVLDSMMADLRAQTHAIKTIERIIEEKRSRN